MCKRRIESKEMLVSPVRS